MHGAPRLLPALARSLLRRPPLPPPRARGTARTGDPLAAWPLGRGKRAPHSPDPLPRLREARLRRLLSPPAALRGPGARHLAPDGLRLVERPRPRLPREPRGRGPLSDRRLWRFGRRAPDADGLRRGSSPHRGGHRRHDLRVPRDPLPPRRPLRVQPLPRRPPLRGRPGAERPRAPETRPVPHDGRLDAPLRGGELPRHPRPLRGERGGRPRLRRLRAHGAHLRPFEARADVPLDGDLAPRRGRSGAHGRTGGGRDLPAPRAGRAPARPPGLERVRARLPHLRARTLPRSSTAREPRGLGTVAERDGERPSRDPRRGRGPPEALLGRGAARPPRAGRPSPRDDRRPERGSDPRARGPPPPEVRRGTPCGRDRPRRPRERGGSPRRGARRPRGARALRPPRRGDRRPVLGGALVRTARRGAGAGALELPAREPPRPASRPRGQGRGGAQGLGAERDRLRKADRRHGGDGPPGRPRRRPREVRRGRGARPRHGPRIGRGGGRRPLRRGARRADRVGRGRPRRALVPGEEPGPRAFDPPPRRRLRMGRRARGPRGRPPRGAGGSRAPLLARGSPRDARGARYFARRTRATQWPLAGAERRTFAPPSTGAGSPQRLAPASSQRRAKPPGAPERSRTTAPPSGK